MAGARLYVDEDAMQHAVVSALRDAGHEVVTAAEAGLLGRADPEHLAFAVANTRTLYSLNVADFARLHHQYMQHGRPHFGIILIPRQRYDTREKIRGLRAFLADTDPMRLRDRLVFL